MSGGAPISDGTSDDGASDSDSSTKVSVVSEVEFSVVVVVVTVAADEQTANTSAIRITIDMIVSGFFIVFS
jgi:hypothetical protein